MIPYVKLAQIKIQLTQIKQTLLPDGRQKEPSFSLLKIKRLPIYWSPICLLIIPILLCLLTIWFS